MGSFSSGTLWDRDGTLSRLWDCWRAEFANALSPMLPRMRILEVTSEGSRLRFGLRKGDRVEDLGDVGFDASEPGAAGPEIRVLTSSAPGRFDRLELRAAPGRGLSRAISLPIAARRSLREAVRFDLDRQTPFSEDLIHFGVAETGLDRAGGKVLARLDVIPRAQIDPALSALAAAGLRPDAVRLGTGDGPNLAPVERLHQPPRWLGPGLALSVIAVLVLGLGIVFVPLQQAYRTLDEAEAEAIVARQAAATAEALARRIDATTAREAVLIERRETEPRALELLAEATRLLPDESYLIQFSLAGEKLTMTGYARRATPLLGRVEQSDHFTGARFAEPVVPDGRMGAERFSITAEVPNRAPNSGGSK